MAESGSTKIPQRPAAFTPISVESDSIAERIADQLRTAMISGSLKPGDRLPSEPELAEGFEVSRPTVREALKILRGQGVIETTRGAKGGHFVRHPKTSDIAESLGETYALWFDIGDISVAEVDEAREVVERACVRLAAKRRTEEDLEAMRSLLDDAADRTISLERFLELEVGFHTAIAMAARNRLLNLPMSAIHFVRPRTNKLLKDHDRSAILAQHRALCDAIASGDPDVAEAALADHVSHLATQRQEAAKELRKDASQIPLSELARED